MSSTPSSEALSPSEENQTDIPYADISSDPRQRVFPVSPNSSSEEDLTEPPPLPECEPPSLPQPKPLPLQNKISDKLITTSRLTDSLPTPPPRPTRRSENNLKTGSLPRQSPQLPRPPVPMPRKASLEKVTVACDEIPPLPPRKPQQNPENLLIQFESSESETDAWDQFDPLMRRKAPAEKSPELAKAADADSSATGGSPRLTRNKSSRNSLIRAEAFRRTAANTPVRSTYREDTSPDREEGSKDCLADLFDPLASVTSTPPAFPTMRVGSVTNHNSMVQSRGGSESKGSASLMHDWTLDQLAGGSGFTQIPAGVTLTCPTSTLAPSAQPVSPMASSRASTIHQNPPPRSQPPHSSVADPFSRDTYLPPNQLYHPPRPPKPSPPQSRPQNADLDSLISLQLDSGAARKPASGMNMDPNPVLRTSAVAKPAAGVTGSRNTPSASLSTPPLSRPQPAPRKSRWETFD